MENKNTKLNQLELRFNDWVESDNVVEHNCIYRCQCNLYKKKMTLTELKTYFIKEYS
jgi:hypothetical protein